MYSQAPLIGSETEVLFHSLFPGYYGGSQVDSYGRGQEVLGSEERNGEFDRGRFSLSVF